MITSLLIANRGEIACRIIRTARAMGVRTVAVYSDADAGALHVRQADEAVHIGASPARESYLVGERIIAAALSTSAEAIHPGYGFLSENADFAQAVIDAGLIWVGPKPDSIRAMGLKDAAKARMIAAGVPVTPGYLGEDQSLDRLQAEADAIGYPVLIKAVAGGGGKGMRIVEGAAQFAEMLASCRREAAASFGDDRVLLEKYILSPRHIEVQVFGDTHGNLVHLFERDCSLQRRHQKVIEEAPAPGMDDATREQVCAAAVKAAKAVDYVGAGTIEFIADASEGLRADRIWFMEMNTRLQVEHPVTEEITGVDLVEWQLRVASGEVLPKRQEELSINGWAIEVRLYAEDPRSGFLPSIGRLEHFRFMSEHEDQWITRQDMGYDWDDVVSPHYDPMLGKLIEHRTTREESAKALASTCKYAQVYPVRTNLPFAVRALQHPEFLAGRVDTAFIERHQADLAYPAIPVELMAAEAGYMLVPLNTSGHDPWQNVGFRVNGEHSAPVQVIDEAGVIHATNLVERFSSRSLSTMGQTLQDDSYAGPGLHFGGFDLPGVQVSFVDGEYRSFRLHEARGTAAASAPDGAILAPMPGRVIAVDVAEGDAVTKGQRLVTLEAMKMEHALVAPFDGTVASLAASEGGQVTEGTVLARIEAAA
jgi:3-methylcrotonyl-CoA carboxylase alpha subunit